jgi:hypothetical protein
VKPPFYGTADTKVDNPSNDVLQSNTGENWSVGDFLGLDNDGDGLYDLADFDCGPYRILTVSEEGDNLRVTWETAGGRSDELLAAPDPAGPFTNVEVAIAIPGVGIVTTNYLELGGASHGARFYRLKHSP